MITSLPNLLTLARILLIPLVVVTFFLDGNVWRWVALGIFVTAGITDFLDGYLARTRQELSKLGRFLDPIADKLLVAAVILMLTAFDRISGLTVLPAVVILCREIVVSGLREFLAELRVSVPVSRLAKWKTAIQMVTLGFLLVGEAAEPTVPARLIGEVGLWVAAILTIITGYDYMRAGLRHMVEESGQ
ncbi:MAG: CDP-diacylglycerol--glycerol-3-phosphate 3-phosphatidyltransferase [Alphaproteobacteria bacterium]|nr:CDP-diacylglycerol--glycerol-3-phosphate 3-phosphatidyltransferase [Alphaproteobacteria bacterium]